MIVLPRWVPALMLAGLGCVPATGSIAATPSYVPDGPDIPTITLNEGPNGAAGLPPFPVPLPNGWDKQSIWNMQMVGFQDNQGRASSDDGWVENQGGRYIAYLAGSPGHALNPMTGEVENNGTSLTDVTDPTHPTFLSHIPTQSDGGAKHLAVCSGNILPHSERNHW